jgi:Carboxypeptidase regulatory-like domain
MAARRAPKRAVWRRHRVWPWALAAALMALGVAVEFRRTLARAPGPPASASYPAGSPGGTALGPEGGVPRGQPEASSPRTLAVLDARGTPVAGCVVELRLPGQRREDALTVAAETCEAVELPAVPPGDYLLSAEALGSRRAERPVHLGPGPSALSLALPDGIALSGEVVDADGRLLPGVSVVVSPTEVVARTDARGAFHLAVPSPGQYSLEAHHSDWGGAVKVVTAPAPSVRLRLEPRAELDLRVESGGHPVEGAQAQLFQGAAGDGREYASDRGTDADGGVQLHGLPPGPYHLEVAAPGLVVPWKGGVVLREKVSTVLAVALPPQPSGHADGLVVDENGKPVSGASVHAAPTAVPVVQSDAEGRFRLQGLQEGLEYSVFAQAGEAQSASRPARSGGPALRLLVPRPTLYRGRVLDEARAPLPAFRVGEVEEAAADGRFVLPLPSDAGRVTFTIEAPGRQRTTLSRPADVEEVGDIVLLPAPAVGGLVLEADGGPAADALVVCEGCRGEGGGERHLATFAAADGRFALSITGPYGVLVRLLATKDGGVGWAEAGRVGEEARLVLAAPASVQGRVLLPRGTPAPGVAVVFVEPLLEPVLLVTGADGTFAGEVPPGLYQVTLFPDASRPRRTWTVQVPPGRALELVTGDTSR